MRLLIMGPPGAGKGTQAAIIGEHYGIPAISTGNIFRLAITNRTKLGERIKRIIADGGYVPDSLSVQVVVDRLKEEDAKGGWLLDGFPRTLGQVQALDEELDAHGFTLKAVVSLTADEDAIVDRMLKRAEIEGRLVQAQGEAVELAAAGEVIEAERDALAEQVAELTRERDTLAGKAEQQAADLADQAQRIEREQQAAESARVELATARLKIEAQAERQTEQAAEIERLRAALADAQQGRTAAEQQAAVLAAKLEACAERVARAEARVEQIEQQAAKAAQANEEARAAAAQEARQVQAERDEARKVAAEAREQAARLAGQLEALTTKERKTDERP